MHPAKGLRACDAASQLAGDIREAAAKFPRGKRYGLVAQLIRAANSIGANIAEGSARKTVPDRLHYFGMSLSSAAETLNHLKECLKAHLLNRKNYYRLKNLAEVTHKLIAALIRQLEG